jgi:hypothetical protein
LIGPDQSRDRPDLAVEVIWTSGGVKKLEIYRRLGVPEVWVWQRGALEVHVLEGSTYRCAAESSVLPGIDPAAIVELLDQPTAVDAMRAYRSRLRQRP